MLRSTASAARPLAVRLLLPVAGALLATAVPARQLFAQSPVIVVPGDTLRLQAPAARMNDSASRRCLSLRVVPGDTTGRAMPRASGETRGTEGMPRAGSVSHR